MKAIVNLLFLVYWVDLTIVNSHSGMQTFGFGSLSKRDVTTKVLYTAAWSRIASNEDSSTYKCGKERK